MEEIFQLEGWRAGVVLIPLVCLLVAASVTDLRSHTIKNDLTYPFWGVGLVARTIGFGSFGMPGFADGLLALVITFVIGFFLFSVLRALGGGDVKLLMGVGAFVGLGGLGTVFFYSVIVGLVIGLLAALKRRFLTELFARIGRFLRGFFRQLAYGSAQVGESMETDERSKIPFAPAVLGGFVLACSDVLWGWPGLLEAYIGLVA